MFRKNLFPFYIFGEFSSQIALFENPPILAKIRYDARFESWLMSSADLTCGIRVSLVGAWRPQFTLNFISLSCTSVFYYQTTTNIEQSRHLQTEVRQFIFN